MGILEILIGLVFIYVALLPVSIVVIPLCNLLMGDLAFDGFFFTHNFVFIAVATFFLVSVLGGV